MAGIRLDHNSFAHIVGRFASLVSSLVVSVCLCLSPVIPDVVPSGSVRAFAITAAMRVIA